MALSDLTQSVRASIFALNYPLYDGNVSREARHFLAKGKIDEAMGEYRRLAALGSGQARSILAYVCLIGTRCTPRDLGEAQRFALAAVPTAPGFSRYILGFIALERGDPSSTFTHFIASRKAGFLPAFSASAQLFSNLYRTAERDLHLSERLFVRAIRAGHVPAYMFLALFYLKGNRGLWKRVLGAALLPPSLIAYYLSWKFNIFSMSVFVYHPTFRGLLKEKRR
jgi:TPR repeat protein